jgi:hypothetical protein
VRTPVEIGVVSGREFEGKSFDQYEQEPAQKAKKYHKIQESRDSNLQLSPQ